MVDIGDPADPEALGSTAGEAEENTFVVGMKGQGRPPKHHVGSGDTVGGSGPVRVVVGHLLGQSPRTAVVAGVVDIVLAAAAVAGAKGDVQIALLVKALVH